MEQDKIIQEIALMIDLDLSYNVAAGKRLKSIPLRELLISLLNAKTAKDAAVTIGISRSTITEICKGLFPEKESKQTWSQYLLSLLNVKRCSSCEENKFLSEFAPSTDKGTHIMCRPCLYKYGSDRYFSGREQHREWNTTWRKNNPDKVKNLAARRRAKLRSATAEDSDLKLIAKIYAECPKGYHVDHIIPLSKGGLHHENNLCYLSISDNLHKKDKMPEEVPYVMARAIYPLELEGFLD